MRANGGCFILEIITIFGQDKFGRLLMLRPTTYTAHGLTIEITSDFKSLDSQRDTATLVNIDISK